MSSKEIAAWLSQVFATVLYPTLVIGVFASILLILLILVCRVPRLSSVVRRATGALLPLAALVILTATGAVTTTDTGEILQSLGSATQFAIGLVLGAGLMEWSNYILRADSDGAASVCAIFLSSLGSFMLWAVMGGGLTTLNWAVLGLVLGAGLDIVFRGIDYPAVSRSATTSAEKEPTSWRPSCTDRATKEAPSIEDPTPWSTVGCTPKSVRGSGHAQGLTLTVEAAKATKRETAFRLAVAASASREGWITKAEGAYVTDAEGTRYELSKERPGPGDPRLGSWSASYSRKLMPTETYRFELAFPAVPQPMPHVHLKHPDFPMVKVSLIPTGGEDEPTSV
jgi:hypothetical protein